MKIVKASGFEKIPIAMPKYGLGILCEILAIPFKEFMINRESYRMIGIWHYISFIQKSVKKYSYNIESSVDELYWKFA